MKFDDSRRRSIMIVAATIFLGASLGYMYSYSKSNRMLTLKHDTMKLNYLTCSKGLQQCSSDLDECKTTTEKWQNLKNDGDIALKAEHAKVVELRNEYEEAEGKLATLRKSFSDIGLLVGLFDDAAVEQNVSKEKVDLIIEKIENLKKNKLEFDNLTTRYNSLTDEVKRLTEEKKRFEQKVLEEQNAKSLVQAELDNLKVSAAAKSDLTTKVAEPEKKEVVNVAPLSVSDKPAPVSDKPAPVSDKPAPVTDEPASVTDEPASVTDEPGSVTDKPALGTDEPASVSDTAAVVANTATSSDSTPTSDQSNQDGNTETKGPSGPEDQTQITVETPKVEVEPNTTP